MYNISTFNLFDGEIFGNSASTGGGGVYTSGEFNMAGGKISGNFAGNGGGGVLNYHIFNMIGGEISDNTAKVYAGGVHNNGSGMGDPAIFKMSGDAIISNNVAVFGGGVYNAYGAAFSMFEFAVISGNTAANTDNSEGRGGGIYNHDQSIFNMFDNAVISDNFAIYGGGIFNNGDCAVTMSGDAVLSDNFANYGGGIYTSSALSTAVTIHGGTISGNVAVFDGGGIYVSYGNLDKVTIATGVTFSNNHAGTMYDRNPIDDALYHAQIAPEVTWTIPFTQGYNNYDISYTNGVLLQTYNIKYELNGGTNPLNNPNTYNEKLLPLPINVPTKAGYDFLGWTVQYANGDSVTTPTRQYQIPEGTTGDIVLTAHWIEIAIEETEYYTVTYVGNGHTSGNVPIDAKNPYESESLVLVLGQGTLAKVGYTFLGWSTSPNANTPTYTTGSAFTITDDVTLFAVWKQTSLPPLQYSVIYRPGLHGTFEEQTTSGLLYGDPTPVAPNVMGQAGWKFTGWSPTPSVIVTGNAIYVAQWEQDSLLLVVRFVDWDGALLKSQSVSYGGDATAPQNLSRPGYIFVGWDRSFTNVVEDITVTALYTKSGSGTSSTPTPSTTPPPPTVSPPSTTPPTNNGGNNNNGGNGDNTSTVASWAFVNLALSVAGVILVAIAVVCILLQDKRKQKQNNKTDNGIGGQSQGEDGQRGGVEKQKRRNSKWLIVAAALAIVGIVVFLFTENVSLPMQLLDKWTIVNAVVFGLVIVALAFVFRHKNQTNKQQQTPNTTHNNP